jgi:hypothetical protein
MAERDSLANIIEHQLSPYQKGQCFCVSYFMYGMERVNNGQYRKAFMLINIQFITLAYLSPITDCSVRNKMLSNDDRIPHAID